MMVIGIDAHKRSHTAVRIDDNGRLLATKTVGTTTRDHLRLVKRASEAEGERRWVIEDVGHGRKTTRLSAWSVCVHAAATSLSGIA